jgi:hypothetical protein
MDTFFFAIYRKNVPCKLPKEHYINLARVPVEREFNPEITSGGPPGALRGWNPRRGGSGRRRRRLKRGVGLAPQFRDFPRLLR